MKVLINKRFLKDLARLPHAERSRVEKFVFQDILKFESIEGYGAFEKLRGYHAYYRARFGDYRVGVKFEEGTLTFERVLHRREIYRFFP